MCPQFSRFPDIFRYITKVRVQNNTKYFYNCNFSGHVSREKRRLCPVSVHVTQSNGSISRKISKRSQSQEAVSITYFFFPELLGPIIAFTCNSKKRCSRHISVCSSKIIQIVCRIPNLQHIALQIQYIVIYGRSTSFFLCVTWHSTLPFCMHTTYILHTITFPHQTNMINIFHH